jgi:MFS family permease
VGKGPLASANFRLLLACTVTSQLGTAMAVVAVPFAVLGAGGSATDVGYVAASGTAPLVVFLLWGGVVADRMPRHLVMTVANFAQGAAQAAGAALVLTGTAKVWELAAVSFCVGTGVGFSFPASAGLLPETVAATDLPRANALNRLGYHGAAVLGSALGGAVAGTAGPGWALAVDAASYLAAGTLRFWMRLPATPPGGGSSMLADLREGWREFTARRWLWSIVGQFALMLPVYTGTLSVVGPVVAHTRLGGARAWGVIVAGLAAGAITGGALMLRYQPRRMLLAASLAELVQAAFLLALAVPAPVPVITATAFATGVSFEVFGVNWTTTMQQEIPPGMLSRLSAYDGAGSFALAPAGTAVAGPLTAVLGARTVLVAGAVIVVTLTSAVLCVPEVRGIQRRHPAAASLPAGR